MTGKSPTQFNWDDLRFIIAVAQQGTTLAAAKALGVNATTVQRRIARFEQDNAIHLFERRQTGLHRTPECEALLEASLDVEERVAGIQREILGRDLRLEGKLTVTSTETFMTERTARHFDGFKTIHPDIELEITLTNSRLDLSRSDTDIAIRPSLNPPEHLVGQRVSALAFAIYADKNMPIASGYKSNEQSPDMEVLRNLPWIGFGPVLSPVPGYSWLEKHIPANNIRFTADTFPAVKISVAAGRGAGLLPCNLGDVDRDLVRLSNPIEELQSSLWVLTHPEIRSAAKIRAFMDFFTRAIRGDRDIYEGRSYLPLNSRCRCTTNE